MTDTESEGRVRAPRKGQPTNDPVRKAKLRELKKVADQLAKTDDLYERRYQLIRELRALDPPVPQAELAEICRTSPNAITQLMRASKHSRK